MHNSKKNVCLNYHDFTYDSLNNYSNYAMPIDKFEIQLDNLKSHNNIALTDLLNPTSDNKTTYCLTFDDGKKSNLKIAEILAKRDLKGTFFIIKNETDNNPLYLNSNEIKEISKLGMEIGSHTCSHRHMNRLDKKTLINELNDSKLFLEDLLSKQVISIAYPGGHYGKREIECALKIGYKINRTVDIGYNLYPLKNGLVNSFNIKSSYKLEFFNQITGIKPIPFVQLKSREIFLFIPKYLDSIIHHI